MFFKHSARTVILSAILFIFFCSRNPGMRKIPGGTFQMGSADTTFKDEQPVHTVSISTFFMDARPVTQKSFKRLMNFNPSHYTEDSLHPVEMVSWFDAVLYCNARSKRHGLDTVYSYTSVTKNADTGKSCSGLGDLTIDFARNGFRLPTEAEYEYACRAGTTTEYYWGGSYPLRTRADTLAIDSNAVWYHNSQNGTEPVGSRKPNAWGLYDMSGNVWEWCNDWYDSYDSSSHMDPTGPSTGSKRVLRGVSWGDSRFLRAANRSCDLPNVRNDYFGFRCVRR